MGKQGSPIIHHFSVSQALKRNTSLGIALAAAAFSITLKSVKCQTPVQSVTLIWVWPANYMPVLDCGHGN
jgi:hypothetical protein